MQNKKKKITENSKTLPVFHHNCGGCHSSTNSHPAPHTKIPNFTNFLFLIFNISFSEKKPETNRRNHERNKKKKRRRRGDRRAEGRALEHSAQRKHEKAPGLGITLTSTTDQSYQQPKPFDICSLNKVCVP